MEIPLPAPQFLIGRDPRCNLRPSSEAVSKLHCAIVQRDNAVFVRDLKSTNGTFVNNDRIGGEVQVHEGDLLRVGPLVLAFKIEVGAAATDTPAPSNEEDQVASWLLDYSPRATADEADLGTKTTIMDMKGDTKSTTRSGDKSAKVSAPVEPKTPEPASRARTATPEVAGDILNKLLTPARKKRS
jgi:pSer/pThr/pTyr-binding forkhead associated (FHA) protein